MEKFIGIKDSFINENFNQQQQYILSIANISIIGETENATHLEAYSEYGTIKFWVPNSCLVEQKPIEYIPVKKTKSPIKTGLEINHATFGKGIILSNKKGIVEIQFEDGKKRFETKYIIENCL